MNDETWKNTQEIPVNDGGGLFDYAGLIDTLLVDCNELPNALFNGKNVRFCALVVGMVQKLARLKEGVKNDLQARENLIREYAEENKLLRGESDCSV